MTQRQHQGNKMAKTILRHESNRKSLEITEKEYSWKTTKKLLWIEAICRRTVGKFFNQNMLGTCWEENKQAVGFVWKWMRAYKILNT